MRIAMPLMENEGRKSRIHPHFGHIQFLAVYDTRGDKLQIVTVKPVEGCSPIAALQGRDVDTIYTFGMGMRAMQLCSHMGIKVKTGPYYTVDDVIKNLDKLKDLDDSCGH